jgi:hypothetical protein
MTWRASLPAVLCVGLVFGCASNGKRVGVRPEQLGAYRFTERVTEGVELEGIFVIEADTVSMDARPGPCRYERERSNALAISYTCGDVTYAFDRSDPLRSARYTTVARVQETKSVCVRFTVSSTGRQVCAESRPEVSYRDVRRSGLLRPERMSDDDPLHPLN